MARYKLVQSVERALDLLELVVNADSGMSRRAVLDRIYLNKSTAHNLLRTLVAKGFLVKRRHPIRYCPGPVLVNYRRAQRDYELFQRAKPVLMNLASSLNGDVKLCECVGMSVLSMLTVSPGQEGVMQPHLPPHMLPYGIGSVFLAQWDKHQRTNYESNFPFIKHGKRIWKSRERFNRFLAGFRKDRVAMIPVHLCRDRFRVAAPIFGPRGDVIAIVCFLKPLKETTAASRRKCCEAVRKAGVELSSND